MFSTLMHFFLNKADVILLKHPPPPLLPLFVLLLLSSFSSLFPKLYLAHLIHLNMEYPWCPNGLELACVCYCSSLNVTYAYMLNLGDYECLKMCCSSRMPCNCMHILRKYNIKIPCYFLNCTTIRMLNFHTSYH